MNPVRTKRPVLGVALLLALCAQAGPAPQNPGRKPPPAAAEPAKIPESVFDTGGKDPFYPNRVRGPVQNTNATAAPEPVRVELTGVATGGLKPTAKILLNRIRIFVLEVGDSREVKLPDGTHHLKCVEIKDSGTVTLEIDGQLRELTISLGRRPAG